MANLNRYIKNMALDGITREMQEKLITSKVLVVGAGNLGSNVIMNLCAFGVGHLQLIDDDILQESDFNGQLIHKYKNIGRAKVMSAKDWVQEYNPDIKVDLAKMKLNDLNYFSVVEGFDIIVDCCDDYETKYLLNEIALRHKKVLIHGGAQGFCGQITTIIPDVTGCLGCVLPKPTENTQKPDYATISPVITAISSMQALEVLKCICGIGELITDRLLIFDGLKGEYRTLNYSKNVACDLCNKNFEF